MVDQKIIQAARRNGSLYGNCFGDRRPSVDGVVDLLVEGSRFHRHVAVRVNSNKLLAMMADEEWVVQAGSHTSEKDQTNHYTIRIGNHGYHLRHDARGHLFEISGAGLPAVAPWAAPGTDVVMPGKNA
ncbi:MAG TPA: hypothetical protein VNH11_20735 [Pirellulales bacterium]|nr:hypothetical protein [Pirellulales bacterium]